MRPDDTYRRIGYPPNRSSCRQKVRYSSEADAIEAAAQHEWEIVCTGMNAYWCSEHRCWHIGHRDKHLAARLALLEAVSWFDGFYRRN